jgi:hypothetical protein
MSKPGTLYYYAQEGQDVAGPFDLVQMAALLRKGAITSETMTLCEGEFVPTPFGHRTEFIAAFEMSTHATSMKQEEDDAPKGALPVPSREFLLRVAKVTAQALLLAGSVFFLSYMSPEAGWLLLIAGGGLAVIGQCLLLAKLLDEDIFTLLAVAFIPLYDIFFFISNIDTYYSLLRLKYIGVIIVVAAALATGHSLHAY